jgi:FkbM family methyltransferase
VRGFIDSFMRLTRLGNLQVRALAGLAAGARWTLYPFSSYWRGTSDREAIAWVDRFCRPGGATLDLGAHFGLYTVGMARRVGPSGQVVALEPEATARARCMQHVRMNKLDWVHVFPYAASSTTGMIRFVDNGGAGSTTCFVSKEPGVGMLLPCVRLDDLYSSEGLRPPEFIKIDVENHGAEALEGARNLLGEHPSILMSFHSEQELAGAKAILVPLGYRVTSLAGVSVDWSQALYKTAILTAIVGKGPLSEAPRVPTKCHGFLS